MLVKLKFLYTSVILTEAISFSALVHEFNEVEVEPEDYHNSNISPSNENSGENMTGEFETVIQFVYIF